MLAWAAAVALRGCLLSLGWGEALVWQLEVSTPANGALPTLEGVRLLQLGVSPYSGDTCHAPPLWLALVAPWAEQPLLQRLPNLACDLMGAAALQAAAARLFSQQPQWRTHTRDAPWLRPRQVALLYLFSPPALLASVAGTSGSAENMAALLAVAGGVLGKPPMAGFGLALAAYFNLQQLLLAVPVLLLLWRGPEDVLQQPPPALPPAAAGASGAAEQAQRAPCAASSSEAAGAAKQQHPGDAAPGARWPGRCWQCVAWLLASAAALAVLSDAGVATHADSQCLPALAAWLSGRRPSPGAGADADADPRGARCWALRVHGLALLLRDLTPNIGLWWYFFTQMFAAFVPFFLFVFHSLPACLVAPLALRFPRRPLLVAWALLVVCGLFRPFASAGDWAPWLALLPLLQAQLAGLSCWLFLLNSLLLLAVLAPAMLHQWLALDAANANFPFSISLLVGVWTTIGLTQVLRVSAQLERGQKAL